jgi:chaperone required for assembly of F1-ATPase
MRDILDPAFQPSDPNPMRRAQSAMARQVLPKRFYKSVQIVEKDQLFAISLDGRAALTPGRNPLALPTRAAAEVIAREWQAQVDVIDPAVMHATRIANTAIDSIGQRLAEVQSDIAGYAGSDLVCYRASEPPGLVEAQNAAWNPVVAWAADVLGARLVLAEGVIHQAQPDAALEAVRNAVAVETDVICVAALHVMTTMSGSCLLALMTSARALTPEVAFAASMVDEDWNAALWGRDAEAEARNERRRAEFLAAATLLLALKPVSHQT